MEQHIELPCIYNVCITRWVENIDGWERFMLCHPFLVEMCEVIIYGSEHYPVFRDGFSADDKKNALAHLKSLESFSFIYALVVLHRALSYFRQPMKMLQGISQDLHSGLKKIEDCQKELVTIRGNNDEMTAFSERIYSHSCCLAAKSDITPAVPRICQRQHLLIFLLIMIEFVYITWFQKIPPTLGLTRSIC